MSDRRRRSKDLFNSQTQYSTKTDAFTPSTTYSYSSVYYFSLLFSSHWIERGSLVDERSFFFPVATRESYFRSTTFTDAMYYR